MTNIFRGLICLAAAAVLAVPSAHAQVHTVVPNQYENAAGPNVFLGPLANGQRTYQLIIHQDQLTNLVGLQLNGLSFRIPDNATGPWPAADVTFTNFDIYLSGAVAPANRSLTFADNIVGTETQVRSGSLSIPANSFSSGASPNDFGMNIAFDPWQYTGGHLAVTLRHTGFSGTSRSVDAVGTAHPDYLNQFAAVWTGNYAGVSGSQGNFAVTRFSAIPEPGSALALGIMGIGAVLFGRRRRA